MRGARDMTPAQHRAAAEDSRRRSRESWERSDTDGFLSQWASDLTAQEHEAWADLLEAGGRYETRALFLLDGTLASTHHGSGRFGEWWRLNPVAAATYGRDFFSPSRALDPQREYDNNRRKGFTFGRILVEHYVTIGGSGTGLSGAASARVVVIPVVERLTAGDFEVVTTDAGVQVY